MLGLNVYLRVRKENGDITFTLRKVVFCAQKRQDSTNKRKVEEHVTLLVLIYGNMSKYRRQFVIIWRIKGQINRVITLSFLGLSSLSFYICLSIGRTMVF